MGESKQGLDIEIEGDSEREKECVADALITLSRHILF